MALWWVMPESLHPRVFAARAATTHLCRRAWTSMSSLLPARGGPGSRARPPYPVAQSDVALVVDEQVHAAGLELALRRGAGEMLESLVLMDIYRGDQIGPGRKSLAYRMVFRAPSAP